MGLLLFALFFAIVNYGVYLYAKKEFSRKTTSKDSLEKIRKRVNSKTSKF